jgi:hypothetical protein
MHSPFLKTMDGVSEMVLYELMEAKALSEALQVLVDSTKSNNIPPKPGTKKCKLDFQTSEESKEKLLY